MVDTQRNSPRQPSMPDERPSRPEASNPRDTDVTSGQPGDRSSSHESETLPEMVEASVKGQDEPMEREHPKAPGALIWFSYPLLLLVVLLLAVIAFALINN